MSDEQGSKPITEKQLADLEKLELKAQKYADGLGKPLTDNQAIDLLELTTKRDNPPEPKLGDGAISYLVGLYADLKYGKKTVSTKERYVKYTVKGNLVEKDAIDLLSFIDDKIYEKNGKRITNDYLSGTLDIFEGESITNANHVIDIKSSWDLESLIRSKMRPINKLYWAQMQGYLALTGAKTGELCYLLVNTPEVLIMDEKRRLMYSMNVATDEDPEYLKKAAKLEFSMTFDDLPVNRRIARFPVERDDDFIEKAYKRVELCRKWLVELDYLQENNLPYIKLDDNASSISDVTEESYSGN